MGYPSRTFVIAKSCTNSRIMSHLLLISQSRNLQFTAIDFGTKKLERVQLGCPHTNLAIFHTILSIHYHDNEMQGLESKCCC